MLVCAGVPLPAFGALGCPEEKPGQQLSVSETWWLCHSFLKEGGLWDSAEDRGSHRAEVCGGVWKPSSWYICWSHVASAVCHNQDVYPSNQGPASTDVQWPPVPLQHHGCHGCSWDGPQPVSYHSNSYTLNTLQFYISFNRKIKRIVFYSLNKFDGEKMALLSSLHAKQIAGRAGRYGMDHSHGSVTTLVRAQYASNSWSSMLQSAPLQLPWQRLSSIARIDHCSCGNYKGQSGKGKGGG